MIMVCTIVHIRRIHNFRGLRNQVSPPRERKQQQPPFPIKQAPSVQILKPPVQPQPQQPPPQPLPIAPIPPLPIPENRAVNVISLDAKVKATEEERGKILPKEKGKAKVEDVDAMPIKRARQEEAAMSETRERRKSKKNGKSNSKKKSKLRRKITIKDFALGECSQLYNLVDDVLVQGPKITWLQMCIGNGPKCAQICVTTEQTIHRLGLKVNAPAPCKAKMANNAKVKCLDVINALKMKKCEIEVEVDVCVMPTKGEGYPIILGRPSLMAMQARQDWGTSMLELQPHKGARKGKAINIDLRKGKHDLLELETSMDEFSSSDYSTSKEESTITDESDSSQDEIMGVVLTDPTMVSSINVLPMEEGKLAEMLAKDLTQEERQAYLAMLEGYPTLFIDDYNQIMVQHHINLKDGAKLVVQRLQRLGVVQQDALLLEVVNALLRRPNINAMSIATHNDLSQMIDEYAIDPDFKDAISVIAKRNHLPEKESPKIDVDLPHMQFGEVVKDKEEVCALPVDATMESAHLLLEYLLDLESPIVPYVGPKEQLVDMPPKQASSEGIPEVEISQFSYVVVDGEEFIFLHDLEKATKLRMD
ncbi:hypothetical protein L7F22_057132 [Adiantum nelumboides]|nr:hypothetical protein [Adiantum nelumboides]